MKHILKGVMAFAVCVLLVQCRKPNLDGWKDHVGHTETIEFTAGYGHDEKGTLETVGAALRYRWDIDNTDGKTDRLLVYAQGGDVTTFTSGTYLGSIPIVKVDPSDPCKATFRGVLGEVPEKGVLRFVHVGQDVAVDKGAANISFADQDGSLGTISKKIIAVCDEAYTKIESFNDGKLAIRFAVCKLDMSGFSAAVGNKVDMSCIVHNGVSINADGTISYTSGTYSNLNGVTAASTQYYIVMMPVNDNTRNIVLSCKDSSGRILTSKDLKAVFKANGFYTKPDGSGNPSGESYAPTVAQSVSGLLPGVFTVGPGKSVHFTQGNLWCNVISMDGITGAVNCKFYLENNQFYSHEAADYAHLSHFQLCYDLFRTVIMKYQNNTYDNYIIPDDIYPPITNHMYNLEKPNPNFTVYAGSVPVTGLYRVLSNTEYGYLLNRKVNDKFLYGLAKVGDYDGLVLLPDNWDVSKYSGFNYGTSANFTDNTIGTDVWNNMQNDGAVFLRAAGYRQYDAFSGFYGRGIYMSSKSYISESGEYCYEYLNFGDGGTTVGQHARRYAASIRLVCDSDNL
ncbi:MAG: hypothetical protein Q4F69_07545 [Bacteroidia bacterium]|nr:hypothetical protein [Bacteroidia bacterium]